VAGAIDHLVFTTQPPSSTASTGTFGAVVSVEDTYNNVLLADNSSQIQLGLATGSGTLTGCTAPVTTTAGVATFSSCSITLVGNNYSLTATDLNDSPPAFPIINLTVTSNVFSIVAGAATQVVVTSGNGQSGVLGTALSNPLVATVEDVYGNAVLVAGTSVTFTAPSSGASGAFANSTATTTVLTNASGVATATAFTVNLTCGSYAVAVSSSGLSAASLTVSNIGGNGTTILCAGQVLSVSQSLISAGGGYYAVMQADGNFVVYTSTNTPIWSNGKGGSGQGYVTVQTDGNFVEYLAVNNSPLWATATAGSGAYLVMQTDGNLVLYNGYNQPLWSSKGGKGPNPPPPPPPSSSSTLSTGGSLQEGNQLVSANGTYRAILQTDGNFVVYYGPSTPIWANHVSSGAGAHLVIQSDGNLVEYSVTNTPLWATGTAGANCYLVMQNDGNLVLYTSAGVALWSTGTGASRPILTPL
jgi:hypothetical protein